MKIRITSYNVCYTKLLRTYDNNATLINNIAKNKRRSISQIIESKGIVFQLFSRFLNRITPKADVNDDRLISCITYIRKNINENIV